MNEFHTKYGVLRGVVSAEIYENGILKECILEKYSELKTPYGQMVPQYEHDDVRRKYTASITFYKSGSLKSIALNHQTDIVTPLGLFEVEKITFYEDEQLKRIFPVNGKLTGYWTEENEYALAQDHTLQFSFGDVKSKIMCLQFYPSQKPKSITLWPKERVEIQSYIGSIQVRTGIALYETGMLKSCEPAEPTPIMTPIGTVLAYDINALGIHGDTNSLQFNEDGALKSLVTSTDRVEIYDEHGNKTCYSPGEMLNHLNYSTKEVIPLHIDFYQGKVSMNEEIEYALDKYSFSVINHYKTLKPICSDCSTCHLCD